MDGTYRTDAEIKRRYKMEKTCALCGTKITSDNNGFSDLLSSTEQKKVLHLQPKQAICTECKFTVMAVEIISPFYR